jgi:uncharacterized Zn-finger protein
VISKDENAIAPIIEVKEDGYLWTIFASADTPIPRGVFRSCSTGLRITIPKGIVGKWREYPASPEPLIPISEPIFKEDSGSLLKVKIQNPKNAPYLVKKGEILAYLRFTEGRYERTPQDHGRDVASVCALARSARKPELSCMAGPNWNDHPTMYWSMYAAKEVSVPARGEVIVPLGATFDVPYFLYGIWDAHRRTPWVILDINKDSRGNSDTQQVLVQNFKPYEITIPKHTTVGIMEFRLQDGIMPHPYDLHPTASICSIAPGAKVSRENRSDPWRIHPIETVVIPPYCKQTITTGVTFHVHPDYVGKWDSYPKDNRELVPVTVDYVKDPEVTVRNCTDRPMVIFPETPIATMKLQPDLKVLNPVSL